MERRVNGKGESSSVMLQRKLLLGDTRRQASPELSDLMTDMFYGTKGENKGKKSYYEEEEVEFDDSTRSNSSKMTEEWLEEARRVVAASPTRGDSPRRLVGSPRFAAAQGTSSSPGAFSLLDRRDPLSRSARRNRAGEGLGGEILSKTTKHTRNKSATSSKFNLKPPSTSSSFEDDGSPATAVHRWFSNILNPTIPPHAPDHTRSFNRRSRFRNSPPPQSSVRRTVSSPKPLPLSPPRNTVQSAHRRRLSSSTCCLEKIDGCVQLKEGERSVEVCVNGFLKEQRGLISKVMNLEIHATAQIILSAPSNSVTSMVAAICYAWLLWYRQREKDDGGDNVVVPVMNVKRSSMLNHRQAAWLFHHAGLDATSLLFADEVDMEDIMMFGRLNIQVVGEDILSATSEAGSKCTILTDNYCEDAYDLLQDPVLQKLLLSGILLDTQNLKSSASSSMTRDSEAIQLLLVGSAPNYRSTLFDQLMLEQKDTSFIEALHQNYRKPSDASDQDYEGNTEQRVEERKLTTVSDYEVVILSPEKKSTDSRGSKNNKASPQPAKLISPPVKTPTPVPQPARTEKEAPRGKNVFFLARWFGFGSK